MHVRSALPLLAATTLPLALSGCMHGQAGRSEGSRSSLSHLAQLKDYRAARVSTESRGDNNDWKPIAAGETLVLADIEGPGEITHIWCTINSRDPRHQQNMVVRMYWDGSEFPSVEAPIGDFFGLGMNKYYIFENQVQAVGSIRGLNCFWPMPFAKSARITVTNESDIPVGSYYYYVDWRQMDAMPAETGYFHAQYRQAIPAIDGERYTILDTRGGRGHFVGTNVSIHTQVGGWWGEGDDVFIVDGEERASIWGTGSEDYFSGAWCYGETFHNDYFGMPYREKPTHASHNWWNVYRYHIENPIPFRESLRVEIEHGHDGTSNTRNGGRNNDYASVAYWYMERPVPLIGALPAAADRRVELRSPARIPGVVELQYGKWESIHGLSLGDQSMGEFQRDGALWLNGDQLFMERNDPARPVEIKFSLEQDLRGPLFIHATQAPDYGKVRILLDGKIVAPEFNGYADRVRSALIECGSVDLKAGEHTLQVDGMGRDERSKNTLWGLDYLRVGGTALPCEAGSARVDSH